MAKIHIGKKIREVVDKSGLTIVAFADKACMSRDGAYKIFAKKYLDTEQLSQISEVLQHDFFRYYSADLSEMKEPAGLFNTLTKGDFEYLNGRIEEINKKVDEKLFEKPATGKAGVVKKRGGKK